MNHEVIAIISSIKQSIMNCLNAGEMDYHTRLELGNIINTLVPKLSSELELESNLNSDPNP